MIERAYQQGAIAALPKTHDRTIPTFPQAETETLSILSVRFQWGSLLTAAGAVATVMGSATAGVLLALAPAVLTDGTVVTYLRIRRS
ncbi:hypothetical protein [Streptomyces katrae]|uniref:Uncharacterized protein n=1 Tax=Streptomyces katrae TaxID=68223 RepID=A0A0F4JB80_9ACTN|nr:hypothetical protein [Streptomyces katrae]KJY31622.1 hypothetical protein VR44_17740 [Streptomyces katrae]